jgi:uncharacterized protein
MKFLFLFLLKIYQGAISPYLGRHCRFYPSCSDYAKEAIRQKGAFSGVYLSINRVLRCHPFHPGGYDVVKS